MPRRPATPATLIILLLAVAWLVASASMATAYLWGIHMLSQSLVSAQAALHIDAPFVYRLLVPWTLGLVLPDPVLDSYWLRWLMATCSMGAVLGLMPAYAARFQGANSTTPMAPAWLFLATVAVLICHYVLPHRFRFYYIYDLPAVVMYMVTFLVLTSSMRHRWLWGGLMVAVFSLNRETVVIAVFHAAALQWGQQTSNARVKVDLIWKSVLLTLPVVVIRWLLVQAIDAPKGQVMEFMDGDQLRLLANVQRVLSQYQHTVALMYFGCGAVVWLSLGWSHLGAALQRVARVSMLPFALLMVVGNPTELRIFNEFVPLLALALFVVSARLISTHR